MVDPVRAAPDEVDRCGRPGVVSRSSESGDVADVTIGDRDAALRALLVLSMDMTAIDDDTEIVRLASMAVPSLGGHSRAAAVRLAGAWASGGEGLPDADAVAAEVDDLGHAGGEVHLAGAGWSWAFPLAGPGGILGHMLVEGDVQPAQPEMFLLGLLAQHTGAALVNADLHRQEQATATRERALVEELSAANLALERAVQDSERARELATRRVVIHDRLTRAAVTGTGEAAVAQVVHELTRRPVAIEDRFGTLIAWAGPARPDPYPKLPTPGPRAPPRDRPGRPAPATRGAGARRCQRRRRAARRCLPGRSRRRGRRARPRGARARRDGPGARAGTPAQRGGHRAAARSRPRRRAARRRGTSTASSTGSGRWATTSTAPTGWSSSRSRADGATATCRSRPSGEPPATPRSARCSWHATADSPCSPRASSTGRRSGPPSSPSSAPAAPVGQASAACARIRPTSPRSYREADVALNVQIGVGAREQVASFDDLGSYGLLAGSSDVRSLDRFIERWLGALRDHDISKGAELVRTLSVYLECGGNYDDTARRLSIHRSSVRYRLGQIRRITGCDLADAGHAVQPAARDTGVVHGPGDAGRVTALPRQVSRCTEICHAR